MDYGSSEIMNQALVIDNGSGTLKAGFAADPFPKCIIPNWVGRPKHEIVMYRGLAGDTFIGEAANKDYRGLLKIKYPMEHGIVQDWKDMEEVWKFVYAKESQILGGKEFLNSEDHPVLMTEAPLNPRSNQEQAAAIMFDTLGVPGLFFSMQAVLALYASGTTTGVVLDSGDGVTMSVPIFQGYSIKHAITRVDLAGRDVTRHLQLLLRKEGLVFRTSAEFEIVRQIKEEACYVAPDIDKEHNFDVGTDKDKFYLPDRTCVKLGPARFRAPEILFKPEEIGEECLGIHEVLDYSIRKTDMDLRKELYSKIYLCGGSTLYKGFGDRLLKEVTKLAPKDLKIKIFAPPERKYSAFIGGAILAQLSAFRNMWITKQQWDEQGASILQKKRFQ